MSFKLMVLMADNMENRNTYHTHKWVVKSTAIIMDNLLLVFLLWFGVTHNLFNWGTDWWYSLLTLLNALFTGYIINWENKED
jgi:hypothetical protein